MTSKKFVLITLLFGLLTSCGTIKTMNQMFKEKVSPETFKTQLPFIQPKNDRIFIQVIFDKEKKTRTLLFDTHAPFCINNSIIDNSSAFIKLAKSNIPKVTPDGKKIDNIFYLTDSVKFGNVRFDHVLVNGIPDKTESNNYKYDGIFGDNLLIKGVWKIDFEHGIITLTNTIDSIEGLENAKKIETSYSRSDNFKIDCVFENNVKETMEIDLGYNGYFTMPKNILDKIDPNHTAIIKKGTSTSAAGTQNVTQYILDNSSVKFGNSILKVKILSSDVMNKKYIGVGFFSKFKFIVLDYPNKTLYISNETL